MKYTCSIINQPWEDPGVLVHLNDTHEYWLFDCGDLSRLSVGILMDTTKVFVTHSHIDHFIGFDTIMRMNLRESKNLCFYGPVGLASQIGSRLQGYSWNLTDDSEFSITCYELEDIRVVSYTFRAVNKFIEDIDDRRSYQLTHPEFRLEDGTMLRFAPLSHGVTCLCYSITEPLQARIDKEVLAKSGLTSGTWVGQLLKICSGQIAEPLTLKIGDQVKTMEELRDFVYYPKPSRHAYVTDTILNRDSMASIRWVAMGAAEVACEACYRHAELDKGRTNRHLTSRQAGRIAKELKAGELHLFHYSRRYRGELWPHIREAQENFPNTTPPPMVSLPNQNTEEPADLSSGAVGTPASTAAQCNN